MRIPNLSVKHWLIVVAIGVVLFFVILSRIGHTKASTVIPDVPVGKPTSSVESNKKTEDVVKALNAELDKAKQEEAVKTTVPLQGPLAQQQAMQTQQIQQLMAQQAYLRSQNYGSYQRPVDQAEVAGEKSFVLSFKDEPVSQSPTPVVDGTQKPKADAGGGFPCGLDEDYYLSSCIQEGKVIMATLTNELRGDYTGPVIAQVSQDFISNDKKHVLVPAGTVVLGESGRVEGQEQSRLAIAFHRMILSRASSYHPAGWAYSLDKLQGLSVDGSAGQEGKVNRHIASTMAAAAAYGLLAGFSLSGTGSYINGNGYDMYRQGVSQAMGQQGQQTLSRMMNRMPTITIPLGYECDVYMGTDLRMRQ